MSEQPTVQRVRWAGWMIQRNPTCLISAALMAVGARLYLVSPSTRAGDVGMILMTLGVLQGYEWAVFAILLALHRWGRSPEDKPSLLLVAALFWTGPLAATAEMTAHRVLPGLICAGLCCAIALWELRFVRRTMGLRFSLTGRMAACACVVLLAVAQPLVKVPTSANGTNELFLYATWWLLGALALAGVATVRHHTRSNGWPMNRRDLDLELCLLTLAVGVTAVHLVGMNYACFGHAQWFYGSPLMIAVAVILMEFVASTDPRRLGGTSALLLSLAVVLPAVAIMPAFQAFDEHLPLRSMPKFLRDPLLSTLVIAAAAWWFGFMRTRAPIMLHAGAAALAWAVFKVVHLPTVSPIVPTVTVHPVAAPTTVAIAIYAVAAYLVLIAIIRRSRTEALAGIVAHQVALTLLVWDRSVADVMIVCLSAGWCWIASLAVIGRPTWSALAMPVAFLLLVTWGYDWNAELCWHARSHAAAMLLVLVGVSLVWPDSRYGLLTICAGTAHGLFYAGRWVSVQEHATATFVIIAAFAMLAISAFISWQKPSLLAMLAPRLVPTTEDDTIEM